MEFKEKQKKLTLKKAKRLKELQLKYEIQGKVHIFDVMDEYQHLKVFFGTPINWQQWLIVYYVIFDIEQFQTWQSFLVENSQKQISDLVLAIIQQISFFLPCPLATRKCFQHLGMQMKAIQQVMKEMCGQKFTEELQRLAQTTGDVLMENSPAT